MIYIVDESYNLIATFRCLVDASIFCYKIGASMKELLLDNETGEQYIIVEVIS